MNWTAYLQKEIDDTYKTTEALMRMVDDGELGWKPETGANWMTTGQLLMHLTNACGMCCKGFVTGEWPMPTDMPEGEMLPPAEKMPAVETVEQALQLLAADKGVALEMVESSGENDLANKDSTAPWDPNVMKLGHRLMHMVGHLNNHKNQLYYYLKLQGKPVNTFHLYGM